MAELQRITVKLERAAESTDHWKTALIRWPGFRVLTVSAAGRGATIPFTLDGEDIICSLPDGEACPLALVELKTPAEDVDASRLDLDREKQKTEDLWRSRIYLFSIGSALLTAVVTISVAIIARPSASTPAFDVDAVQSCRDSLQRLSTLPQLPGQTVDHVTATAMSKLPTPRQRGCNVQAAMALWADFSIRA
jgi:hypothetical protein